MNISRQSNKNYQPEHKHLKSRFRNLARTSNYQLTLQYLQILTSEATRHDQRERDSSVILLDFFKRFELLSQADCLSLVIPKVPSANFVCSRRFSLLALGWGEKATERERALLESRGTATMSGVFGRIF